MKIGNLLSQNYSFANRINHMQNSISKSQNALSTGKRINSGADNPGELGRVSKFTSLVRGRQVAQRNIQDGVSLIQVADSALSSVENIAQRIRELGVQYKNDTIGITDKESIKLETKALTEEISNILKNTKFGDINVFDKSAYNIQTGPNSVDDYKVTIPNLGKIDVVTTSTRTEIVGKKYNLTTNGNYFSGNITIKNPNPNSGERNVTLISGCKIYNGTIDFKNGSKEGVYNLTSSNDSLSGKLILNTSSSPDNINGENTYTAKTPFLGIPYSDKINFTFAGNETKVINTTTTKAVALKDINQADVENVLDLNYLDNNLLKDISKARSSLGMSQEVLEHRNNYQSSQEINDTNTLSKIESVDMAKEMAKMVKEQMLLNSNINLISNNLDEHRSYIAQILR